MHSQTVKMATELRKPVYRPVASRAISYEHVLQQMNNVRWDIKEIMSQHNSYIDTLLMVSGDSFSFSFCFSSRWHCSARKGPYALRPISQQSPQGCPRNSTNICLVEHRSLSTLEGGMSAASFLHSSFFQAVSALACPC